MSQLKIWNRRLVAGGFALLLTFSTPAFAADMEGVGDPEPRAPAMLVDLVVARPIGAVMTVAGAAVFLVGLPFIVAGGNIDEASRTLVLDPGYNTLVRCLGCKVSGWRGDYDTR